RTMNIIITNKMQSAEQKLALVSNFPMFIDNKIKTLNQSLEHIGQMLNSLSYKNVLQRGYAIVRDKDNKIISTSNSVPASVEFADGILKID
ncbi:MAG: hypothetical protein IKZ49_01520, partial [Alphaproteobacteria bacterium]|nr:hypothetical protein [Alphaproteobacteria bacterium]